MKPRPRHLHSHSSSSVPTHPRGPKRATMARLAVLCLLAVVCCAAVGAAADPKLMVSDVLVSSKSTKARTSSYYDDTELACMAQLNFKNCRYTGCPGVLLL